MPEPALRSLVAGARLLVCTTSATACTAMPTQFEYRMVLRTMDAGNARSLAEKLKDDPAVLDFRIAPTSD